VTYILNSQGFAANLYWGILRKKMSRRVLIYFVESLSCRFKGGGLEALLRPGLLTSVGGGGGGGGEQGGNAELNLGHDDKSTYCKTLLSNALFISPANL
jgi:hypothetical protein